MKNKEMPKELTDQKMTQKRSNQENAERKETTKLQKVKDLQGKTE